MGSQICKGSGVDVEGDVDVKVDAMFPVQSKSLMRFDWSDELAMDYHSAKNCRHNDALGRALKKHPIPDSRKRESRSPLTFANDIDQIFIIEDLNTDVLCCSETLREAV